MDQQRLELAALLNTNDPYEPALRRSLMRAAELVATQPDTDPVLAITTAQRLFDVLMDTSVLDLRSLAGSALRLLLDTYLREDLLRWILDAAMLSRGEWGLRELTTHPAVREVLLPLLAHDSVEVRRGVIRALEPVATDPDVESALLGCFDDSSWYVRWAALWALEPYAASPAVQAGLQDKLDDDDCNVLKIVVRLLGTKSTIIRERLRDRLDDEDECVRHFAAQMLVSAMGAELESQLLNQLAQHSDPYLRRLACSICKPIASKQVAQEVLLRLLNDADKWVRHSAVEALKLASHVPSIRDILLDLTNSELREEAIEALEPEADRPEIWALLFAKLTEAPGARFTMFPHYGAKVLARAATHSRYTSYGDSPVNTAQLQLLLQHEASMVRRSAIEALEHDAANPAVRSGLLALLSDSDYSVRMAAAEALASQLDDIRVNQALVTTIDAMLESGFALRTVTHSFQYELAVLAANPTIATRLVSLLGNANSNVRLNVVAAMERGGSIVAADTSIRAALLRALGDGDQYVRSSAVRALRVVMKQEQVQEAILPLLSDGSSSVRAQAALALGAVRNDFVVQQAVLSTGVGFNHPELLPGAISIMLLSAEGQQFIRDLLIGMSAWARNIMARELATTPPQPLLRDALIPMVGDWRVANTVYWTLVRWADVEYPDHYSSQVGAEGQ